MLTTDRVAIVAGGVAFTYRDLDRATRAVAAALLAGGEDLGEARVAFLATPGFEFPALQRGIWRAGGVAVPLAISHPPAELDYVIRDAGASWVVSTRAAAAVLEPLARGAGARFATSDALLAGNVEGSERPEPSASSTPLHIAPTRRAMIVYTSGTTARPKGVVTTHANIGAQVSSLVEAWGWRPTDRILLPLPLHHVHGIINGFGCALAVGGICEILPGFDAEVVWDRLASGEITVFTGVPTMYQRLIASYDAAPPDVQRARSAGAAALRLMMSGSAALPVQTFERWRAITGHTLLERFGMTEIGMALSNPLEGERKAGFVGTPLPDVDVRIVDDAGALVPEGTAGELEVRGPTVFREYWQRPADTAAAFRGGWFRTGDVAVLDGGAYRLLRRTSVDIIKTGGFKVSALEIEEVLRQHPAIGECAVVGVPDEEWGERVAAAVELRGHAVLSLEELRDWARARLAPYKVPRALLSVATLPRNALGKVIKPQVAALFKADTHQAR